MCAAFSDAAVFHHQNFMRIHHRKRAVGVTNPGKPADNLGQHAQKKMAVLVVEIDTLPRIAAGSDMVERAGEFKAKGSDQGVTLT